MQPDVSWEEVDTRHTSRSCSDLRISGVTPPMVKRSFKFVGVGERDWVRVPEHWSRYTHVPKDARHIEDRLRRIGLILPRLSPMPVDT